MERAIGLIVGGPLQATVVAVTVKMYFFPIAGWATGPLGQCLVFLIFAWSIFLKILRPQTNGRLSVPASIMLYRQLVTSQLLALDAMIFNV